MIDQEHSVGAAPARAPLLRNGRNWTFDWTSTLTPRMTFDLRAGLNALAKVLKLRA